MINVIACADQLITCQFAENIKLVVRRYSLTGILQDLRSDVFLGDLDHVVVISTSKTLISCS